MRGPIGQERWAELGQFLSDEADHFVKEEVGLAHVRAAKLWQGQLEDPFKATAHWRQALAYEPQRQEAEQALFELAMVPRTAELCAVVLEGHFERHKDDAGLERICRLGLDPESIGVDQAEGAVRVASIIARQQASLASTGMGTHSVHVHVHSAQPNTRLVAMLVACR